MVNKKKKIIIQHNRNPLWLHNVMFLISFDNNAMTNIVVIIPKAVQCEILVKLLFPSLYVYE